MLDGPINTDFEWGNGNDKRDLERARTKFWDTVWKPALEEFEGFKIPWEGKEGNVQPDPAVPLRGEAEDMVNSPEHYVVGGVEAIDVMKAKLSPEEFRGFLKGTILKYLMRANYKGKHDQDLAKAAWYMIELEAELV